MKQNTTRCRAEKDEDMEMEVDISDSSASGSGDEDNGSKEVTHVSTSLTMNVVDLTLDQFLDIVDDRVPSPMTTSSPCSGEH